MGGKDSKIACITYEEATKRVTEVEFKRLKEAFKRASTLNGLMTEAQFVREVLWDGVPAKLAQLIYQAFGGGQKGLTFKDLFCGMVVLTQGRLEEKIKFIFGMYAEETYSYVQKHEMDKRVLETEGQVSKALSALFRENDQVDYEHFKAWVLRHSDATVVSKWLLSEPSSLSLSNDTETPTFYQTLAGVTHLEETDINELETRYWVLKAQSRTGRFDFETFKPLICPPVPEVLAEGLFSAFDENMDNHIDFKEMACGISACCRGPVTERQKFCFKVFDSNHDGKLDHEELKSMLESLMFVRKENKHPQELESDILHQLDAETVTKEILSCHDSDKDGCITMEEYLVWTVNNTLSEDFLNLLSQICHIVLGLRPQTKEEEGKIVMGWLDRESRKSLQVGQTWYLVAIQWWNAWRDYVNHEVEVVANGYIAMGEDAAKTLNPSPSRTKISKIKGAQPLPIEDDHFVVVTKVTPTGESRLAAAPANQEKSFNNHSLGSPMRNSLSANQPDGSTNFSGHSPSPSPKMKKKSMAPCVPQKPGAIDNTPLIVQNSQKQPSLTNEGGKLKRDTTLVRGRDFELIPEPVWRALSGWFGGSPSGVSPALPRSGGNFNFKLYIWTPRDQKVISPGNGDSVPELELYPINVRLLRHQAPVQRPPPATTFTGMMAGIGGISFNGPNFVSSSTPRRYLAYTAAFSKRHTLQQIYDFLCTRLRFCREDIRLWKFKDEHNMTLLDDECLTVEDVGIEENAQLIIEVRNKDLTWPEEMSQLAKNKNLNKKDQTPTDKGATGLSNLGNTCFMNAAVQCVSNTWPLTQYFTGGLHLYELNRTNPLGMKGHIAQRYGDLVKDIWSGTTKTIAPLKLRWTIGKYAPRFNGFQQHDSQELLSFLLDGLHEDLNRVHDKPYVELKDSDGRPDEEVAREAWDNHLLRNQSIIVDLFHGQLRSEVSCKECGAVSVRFDPFNYLSLPLPMDSCIHLEITVIKSDGTVPMRYGMRLNMDEKYKTLKKELSDLSSIPMCQLLLVEVLGPIVKTLPQDGQKIRTLLGGTLYAYELPTPPEIDPMTVEEEKMGAQPESVGLSEIQRGKPPYYKRMSGLNNSPELSNGHAVKMNGHPPQLDPVQTMGTIQSLLTNGSVNGTPVASDSSAPSSPGHSRTASSVSINLISSSTDSLPRSVGDVFNGFVIGVHRKMIHLDVYFLSSQKSRPSLFGTPIILPCLEKTTIQDLYQFVWTQVARLVSPLPPSESKTTNHAQDCDDSLGYEYPFTLKVVQKDGYTCAWCPWYKFCRGCKIDCNNAPFQFGSSFLAIDWEPTALHLRYQTSHERFFEEHSSVEESRRLQSEPIDLDNCLHAFTKEEELAEDELYYCSKCKKHCLAAKKLDIWRLPPILIVNLKRFQFVSGRWVKSHKIVKFPIEDFDPTQYLAPRCPNDEDFFNGVSESTAKNHNSAQSTLQTDQTLQKTSVTAKDSKGSASSGDKAEGKGRKTSVGISMRTGRPHSESGDYNGVRYNLYAQSCHTGILGGGHYVAYAKNPNDKWYCYNDSSCKEVPVDQVDSHSAYILFYERADMNYNKFYPDIRGKEPDMAEIDDEFETEFKKMCVIQ